MEGLSGLYRSSSHSSSRALTIFVPVTQPYLGTSLKWRAPVKCVPFVRNTRLNFVFIRSILMCQCCNAQMLRLVSKLLTFFKLLLTSTLAKSLLFTGKKEVPAFLITVQALMLVFQTV